MYSSAGESWLLFFPLRLRSRRRRRGASGALRAAPVCPGLPTPAAAVHPRVLGSGLSGSGRRTREQRAPRPIPNRHGLAGWSAGRLAGVYLGKLRVSVSRLIDAASLPPRPLAPAASPGPGLSGCLKECNITAK